MAGRIVARDFFIGREWRGRPYLISPFFDAAFAGGLALLVFAALFILFPTASENFGTHKLYMAGLLGVLAFMINDPHFIVSYQLLYRNYFTRLREFRANRALWLRAINAGIVVPIALFCYFAYAMIAQKEELFGYAIVSMLFFVGWHYTKQAYGVFIMLSAMKKIYYSNWQKKFLLANSYAAWAFYSIISVANISGNAQPSIPGLQNLWGIAYQLPNVAMPPEWMPFISGVALFFGLGALIVIIWERRDPPVSKTALVAYLSMYYFLFLASFHPMWIMLYPVFHSLQYALFVFAYKRGETHIKMTQARSPDERALVPKRLKAFILIGFFAGILFFAAIPMTLEGIINPQNSFLFPLTAAMVLFINIHHYFIDNVIWRKENREVGQYLFHKKA